MRLSIAHPMEYIAGVLLGDGWLTEATGLCLKVKDKDFAEAFARSIEAAFGVYHTPLLVARRYWLVRRGNKMGRFDSLRDVKPRTASQKASWLRGLFDSEGNAQLRRTLQGWNCYGRRIAIYSTTRSTLRTAARFMADLGISTRTTPTKNSKGHLGSKTVYELLVVPGLDQYSAFALKIGSNIARKAWTMLAMVASYQPDKRWLRRAQLLGAATKNRNRESVVIPRVAAAIQERIEAGESVASRACESIPGYFALRNHMTHREILSLGGVLFVS